MDKFDMPYYWWISQKKFRIKMWLQRLFRGYADEDIWSADVWIAKRIVTATKRLQEDIAGYPCPLKDDEEWESILKKIQEGFEALIILETDDYEVGVDSGDFHTEPTGDGYYKMVRDDPEAWERWHAVNSIKISLLEEKYKIGMELLVKYFRYLWN